MTLTTYENLAQGSDEWLAARCGIITASVIGKLITPSTLKPANNDTSRGVLHTLAAERITGHVEYVHPTFDMQRGTDDEPFARQVYAEHYAPVTEVGFMVLEEPGIKIGFSPDGLVGETGLIEIKSRKPKDQLATILTGRPPGYHLAQMQTGMLVSGRDWCDYVSFSAGLPLWVHRVYPDPRWQDAIRAAATQFETDVARIITEYEAGTTGLPMTERRPDIEEIRI